MGRRSFEIFGPDLNQSHLIVVSRSSPTVVGVQFAQSLEDALESARAREETIFIGGGASIYEQAISSAQRLHLSEIHVSEIHGDHGSHPDDVYFPEFSADDWKLESIESRGTYDYFEYARRSRAAGDVDDRPSLPSLA